LSKRCASAIYRQIAREKELLPAAKVAKLNIAVNGVLSALLGNVGSVAVDFEDRSSEGLCSMSTSLSSEERRRNFRFFTLRDKPTANVNCGA
jgi:hypothetical protein